VEHWASYRSTASMIPSILVCILTSSCYPDSSARSLTRGVILTLAVILTFHVRTYIDPHVCFGKQLLPEFLGVQSFVQSAALAPNTPESRLLLVISLTNWYGVDTTQYHMATSGQLQQTRPPPWAHFCASAYVIQINPDAQR